MQQCLFNTDLTTKNNENRFQNVSEEKKRKSKSTRISMSLSKSVLHSVMDEKDSELYFDDDDPLHSMQINHGKPTKKIILIFVNEQARNQCLEKIKMTQSKFVKKMQQSKEKNYCFDKNKLSIRASGDDLDSMTKSFSHSVESSFFGIDSHILSNPKPLDSHKLSNLSTPTHSNVSSTQITLTEDFMHSDSSFSDNQSIESKSVTSKSMMITPNHSNNSSVSNMEVSKANLGALKQSVSTEITTIQEENEEDVKSDHEHE